MCDVTIKYENNYEKENNNMKTTITLTKETAMEMTREELRTAIELLVGPISNTYFRLSNKDVLTDRLIKETNALNKTDDNEVPVGDMSSDKYYPELQKEQPKEEIRSTKEIVQGKIIKAINIAKFNTTYHNVPVTYIMTKSLNTIIKYNLAESLRTEENIQKVISGMVKKNILYKCNNKFYGVR